MHVLTENEMGRKMNKKRIAFALTIGLSFLAVVLGNEDVAATYHPIAPHIEAFINFAGPQIPVAAMLLGIGIVGFAGIQR